MEKVEKNVFNAVVCNKLFKTTLGAGNVPVSAGRFQLSLISLSLSHTHTHYVKLVYLKCVLFFVQFCLKQESRGTFWD